MNYEIQNYQILLKSIGIMTTLRKRAKNNL